MSRRSERGAALIEAAFVTPLFVLLIFGVFEFGFLFRNNLTVGNTALAGARAASVSGSVADADFQVLRSVEHGFEAWGFENLEYVVVYRAEHPDSPVPPACKIGPVNDLCNYYRPAEFSLPYLDASGNPTEYWGCGPNSVDEYFCPGDRPTALSWVEPAGSPYEDGPAYIGIYVKAEHRYMTGLIGDSRTLEDTVVYRLEPEKP